MQDALRENDLLEELVKIYSPSGEEKKAVDFLVEQMRLRGFEAAPDDIGNAVGSIGDGPKEIILLGHIDTVPGFIDVRREGDVLYGRGSVDAKGPLSCFVSAAARAGALPGWRVTVIGALGEEAHSPGAYHLVEKGNYHPEMCLIGEPSKWDHITLGYKGSAWFNYTLRRAQEHTAGKGESACESAVAFWNRLQQQAANFNQDRKKLFDLLMPTLRQMHSSSDGFYEQAELSIGTRLPPDLGPAEVSEMFSDLCQDGTLHMADGAMPAYRGQKNTALVRAFLGAIRSNGGKPIFTYKTGTSDMNVVGPVWNCPIAAYGPGDSDLDHTPNEHVSLSEYQRSIDVLTQALQKIAEG